MPARVSVIEKVEPVYERLPGWKTSTFGVSSYDELPARAKDYLAFLERHTGVEAGAVSTGPERTQTMVRTGSRLESLLR
jgi:adenylosuccinate synthase